MLVCKDGDKIKLSGHCDRSIILLITYDSTLTNFIIFLRCYISFHPLVALASGNFNESNIDFGKSYKTDA
jgi:hypothetical protein